MSSHTLSIRSGEITVSPQLRASCASKQRARHTRKVGTVAQAQLRNSCSDAIKSQDPTIAGWFRERLTEASQNLARAGITGLASLLLCGSVDAVHAPAAKAITEENLIFLEAWRAVDRAYVDKSFNGQSWFRYRETTLKKVPMEDRDDTYAAIREMLATLQDPFTRFLEPAQYAALRSGTRGSLTGVGLEVGFSDSSELVVVAPSEGGPAQAAGILPGDAIVAIDGVPSAKMSLYDAGTALQGPEGSTITLTVRSADTKRTSDVPLTREAITLVPVSTAMCPAPAPDSKKVGVIKLSTFNTNSVDAFKEAVATLRGQGAQAFILDIRNNGGGLFPAGVEIAKYLLNPGTIVFIADDNGVRDIYETAKAGDATQEPLVVVVNKGTASASEVLAGALKDNKRATIVGETTFGKGLIQTIVPLSDGSAVVVTVARYQTPSGSDINKIGIRPDVALAPPPFTSDAPGLCDAVVNSSAGSTL